jgi:hypothetical protein
VSVFLYEHSGGVFIWCGHFWGRRKKGCSEALAWEDFIRRDADADALGDFRMSFGFDV